MDKCPFCHLDLVKWQKEENERRVLAMKESARRYEFERRHGEYLEPLRDDAYRFRKRLATVSFLIITIAGCYYFSSKPDFEFSDFAVSFLVGLLAGVVIYPYKRPIPKEEQRLWERFINDSNVVYLKRAE